MVTQLKEEREGGGGRKMALYDDRGVVVSGGI